MFSNLTFITILFIGFMDYVGISLVYPIFTSLLFDQTYLLLPAESTQVYRGAVLGILLGLTPLTQFFTAPILGCFSDIKGRKHVLLYGTFLGFVAYSLAVIGVWMQSFTLLVIYRFLIGVSSSTVPVAQAMIADISSVEEKARRFSIFSASLGVGFIVGPLIAAKLGDPSYTSWSGYSIPFLFSSVVCLISFIVIYYHFPHTIAKNPSGAFNFLESVSHIKKMFFWTHLRWLFLATFAFAFGWSFFNEFIPILLREKFKFTLNDVGNYYAYGSVWYALSSGILAPALLKKVSTERLGIAALVGCAFSMLALLIPEEGQSVWFILPILMFCLSFTYPTTGAMVSNQVGKGNQGEALGVYQSVIGMAMGISPLLGGAIVGAYPELILIGGGLTMFLASLAFSKCSQKANSHPILMNK